MFVVQAMDVNDVADDDDEAMDVVDDAVDDSVDDVVDDAVDDSVDEAGASSLRNDDSLLFSFIKLFWFK